MSKKIDYCCGSGTLKPKLIPYSLNESKAFFNYEYKLGYNIGNCPNCRKLYIQEGKILNNKFIFQKQSGNAVKVFGKIKNDIRKYVKEYEPSQEGSHSPSWVYLDGKKQTEGNICYMDTGNIADRYKAELKVSKIN